MSFILQMKSAMANSDIVYVSIGCNVKSVSRNRNIEHMYTQQFPMILQEYATKHSAKKVSIILIDPSFGTSEPIIMERDVEGLFDPQKNIFVPSEFNNVTIRIVPAFFNVADSRFLIECIQKTTNQIIIIGEFLNYHDPMSEIPLVDQVIENIQTKNEKLRTPIVYYVISNDKEIFKPSLTSKMMR
jgi:hypothetical protein